MNRATHEDLDTLLYYGADIHAKFESPGGADDWYEAGWTPLHIAVIHLPVLEAESLALRRDCVKSTHSPIEGVHLPTSRSDTPGPYLSNGGTV